MKNPRLLLAVLSVVVLPFPLWAAGGHYPVDDADIAEPGQVLVETWLTRVNSNNSEFAVLPAVSFGGALGLTAGVYRLREDGESFTRLEPEAKYLLPWSHPDGLTSAISLAAGFEDGRLEDWLLNLPVSYALDDAISVHANVGWLRLRDRDAGNLDRLFTGVAGEWAVNEAIAVIGQLYREGAEEEPEAQLGFRFAGGGAFEHVDLAIGRVLRGDDRDWFVTVGVSLTF
ncbi:MAG: hypothetical protein JJU27_13400 [Gammaproteobacteria bacterium]|nr:hypothetical protein [Gammaproteobacteria bacterium]